MKNKTWLKYALLLVFAVLFAFLAELLVFHVWLAPKQQESFVLESGDRLQIEHQLQSGRKRLSAEDEAGILIERENGRILAEMNGTDYQIKEDPTLEETDEGMYRKVKRLVFTIEAQTPVYIQNLKVEAPKTAEGTDVLVEEMTEEGLLTLQEFYMDERIHAGSSRIDQDLQSFRVTLSNIEEIDANQVRLIVDNRVVYNPIRLFYLFAAALLLGFFGSNHTWFSSKPERVFAVSALLLGSALIYAVGTNQVGYDEHIHFTTAYNASFSTRVETTESAMQAEAATFPAFTNYEERKLIEQYADVNHDYSWANITYQSRFPAYDVRSYFPLSFGLFLGRIFSLSFAQSIMLAKFMNLLCYTVLGYLSVRTAKYGKGLIAALALLPNYLFAATVFTYDSVVNGFLLWAIVLTTNLLSARKQQITWQQTLLILGAFLAGSTAKAIYILMALLLVFLSKERFGSRLRSFLFKASVAAICGLLLYTVFFPPVSASSNYELIGNLAYAGDKRTQGTSVLGQISYLLENPVTYTALLLRSMLTEVVDFFTGRKLFLNYGYLGDFSVICTWIGAAALLSAAVFSPKEEHRESLTAGCRSLYLVMIFGVSAVVWTSMYISFTAVGSSTIEGVQGRYFLPLFLPFLYCFMNARYTLPIKQEHYNKLVMGIFVCMNVFAVGTLAVTRCM